MGMTSLGYITKFIYINVLGNYLNRATTGSAHINAKERDKKERKVRGAKKRKGIEAQRVKHPNPSRVTDAPIGDEKQNGNKRTKRKRSGSPTQLPWTIQSPPTTRRDNTVNLFF